LRILARTAASPCLPFITAASRDIALAKDIRQAMNQALRELPEVAEVLAISQVIPASEEDYQVLLDYRQQAVGLGLPTLFA